MTRTLAIALVLAAGLAGCSSKKLKDCKAEGGAPVAELTSPWKELELPLGDGGEICRSDASGAHVIFQKLDDWTATLEKVQAHLKTRGWVVGHIETEDPRGGNYGSARVVFQKAGEEHDLAVSFYTYPREEWKNQPVSISVSWRGKPSPSP